jgi:hypothetical protein
MLQVGRSRIRDPMRFTCVLPPNISLAPWCHYGFSEIRMDLGLSSSPVTFMQNLVKIGQQFQNVECAHDLIDLMYLLGKAQIIYKLSETC